MNHARRVDEFILMKFMTEKIFHTFVTEKEKKRKTNQTKQKS